MIKPSLFEIDSELDGTSARIVPSGELDLATTPQLEPDLQLELERDVEAPAIARAAVTGVCEDAAVDQSACGTIVLLVSELVTNALLHSEAPREAPVTLTLTLSEHAVRVTVTDKGHGFTPKPRDPSSRKGGGYGLYLLEKSATRWGVNSLGGTCVWFELNL